MRFTRSILVAVVAVLLPLATADSAPFSTVADYTLSGRISTGSAHIAGATVQVLDPSTGTQVGAGVSDAEGHYSILVPAGTYDIRVTPAGGSGLVPAVAPNRGIFANTTIDFVLVTEGNARVSGLVRDGMGEGLGGQEVILRGDVAVGTVTDADGRYAVNVPPGTYTVEVWAYGTVLPDRGQVVPTYYYVGMQEPWVVTESLVRDVQLPFKPVSVRVQDPAGHGVANVALLTGFGPGWCGPTIDNETFCGYFKYFFGAATAYTDASGQVTLWLIPTAGDTPPYQFTAVPPAGSPFATFVISDIVVP